MGESSSSTINLELTEQVLAAVKRARVKVNREQLDTLIATQARMQERLNQLRSRLEPATQPLTMFQSMIELWEEGIEDD